MYDKMLANESYAVTFPATWRRESIAWALQVHLSQREIDEIEKARIRFRELRDFHQWRRRVTVLPTLKIRYTALKNEIKILRDQMDTMGVRPTKGLEWSTFLDNLQHNHKRDALYDKTLDLSWELQSVVGEIQTIEHADAKLLTDYGGSLPTWFQLAEVA